MSEEISEVGEGPRAEATPPTAKGTREELYNRFLEHDRKILQDRTADIKGIVQQSYLEIGKHVRDVHQILAKYAQVSEKTIDEVLEKAKAEPEKSLSLNTVREIKAKHEPPKPDLETPRGYSVDLLLDKLDTVKKILESIDKFTDTPFDKFFPEDALEPEKRLVRKYIDHFAMVRDKLRSWEQGY